MTRKRGPPPAPRKPYVALTRIRPIMRTYDGYPPTMHFSGCRTAVMDGQPDTTPRQSKAGVDNCRRRLFDDADVGFLEQILEVVIKHRTTIHVALTVALLMWLIRPVTAELTISASGSKSEMTDSRPTDELMQQDRPGLFEDLYQKGEKAMKIPDNLHGSNYREFVAYDCSNPVALKATTSSRKATCGTPAKITNNHNKTYTIIQKADFVRIPARRCHVRKTRIPMYCGNTDHQTVISHWLMLSRKIEVPLEQCQEYWNSQGYVDPKNVTHYLYLNATTTLQFHQAGWTFFSWTQLYGHEAECDGGPITRDGITYNDIVEWVQLEIELTEETLNIRPDQNVMVDRTQTILPCRVENKFCHSGSGTYYWDRPTTMEQCDHFRTIETTGVVTEDEQGNQTFISNDDTMIRLSIGKVAVACQIPVLSTNYPKLFLAEPGLEMFARPLHPAEMSIYTYTNQQDKFIIGEVQDHLRGRDQTFTRSQCEREKHRRSTAFAALAAEQMASTEGETSSLGGGKFATAAGEAWYTYRCRPITVIGIDADECYSALPIHLIANDAKRYLTARYPNATEEEKATFATPGDVPRFFMEPHTNRLTTIGTPTPCVAQFAPLYRNKQQTWVQVSPALQPAGNPEMIQAHANTIDGAEFEFLEREYQTSPSGIYTQTQVAKMEVFTQAPRAAKDLNIAFAQQYAGAQGTSRHISPHDLFNEVPDMDFDIIIPFWDFIKKWGQVATIIIAATLVWRFLTWTAGLLLRSMDLWSIYGCNFRLLAAFLPSAHTWMVSRTALNRWTTKQGTNKGPLDTPSPTISAEPDRPAPKLNMIQRAFKMRQIKRKNTKTARPKATAPQVSVRPKTHRPPEPVLTIVDPSQPGITVNPREHPHAYAQARESLDQIQRQMREEEEKYERRHGHHPSQNASLRNYLTREEGSYLTQEQEHFGTGRDAMERLRDLEAKAKEEDWE